MKTLIKFLLLIIVFVGVAGCDSYDDFENETKYDEEPIEDRTYDGVVYNKAYFQVAEDRSSKSESWYVFSEAEKKVIIERQGGYKRGTSANRCHILEGTYEGELGDKITIHITKKDNELIDYELKNTLVFLSGNNDKYGYKSPSIAISRVKSCYADIQNR